MRNRWFLAAISAENRLDFELATLSGHEATFPVEQRDSVILGGIGTIREYRREFPAEVASDECADDAVAASQEQSSASVRACGRSN
jgi:hypothetical protein